MELISNTAGGFKPPVSDASDSAWVMQQDLHNLSSPPDTKTLSIISLKWKNVSYQCLLVNDRDRWQKDNSGDPPTRH